MTNPTLPYGPLSSVRVVDMSNMGMGSFATQMLGVVIVVVVTINFQWRIGIDQLRYVNSVMADKVCAQVGHIVSDDRNDVFGQAAASFFMRAVPTTAPRG